MFKMIKASFAGHTVRSTVLLVIAGGIVGFVLMQSKIDAVVEDQMVYEESSAE